MKSTFISREKNEVKFSIEFSPEEFEQAIIAQYQINKGKFAIDGFRKGKAPRKLIETHYGEDIFFEDAINEMFSANYTKALDELEINIVDRPSIEFTEIAKGKGFTVTVEVTVYPQVEVKDYKGIKIDKVTAVVSDEDVQAEIEALQKRNARMVLVERAVQDGDMILVDYEGSVDGVNFEGGTAERYSLKIGSNTFIPGFEEQLIGVETGGEKDVKVTFPEEYHTEDLAGKEAIFKCKVHEIKEEELPELNDDFAKDVSECETLEALKNETRQTLEKAAVEKAESQMKNSTIEKILDANEVDIPDVMVEDEIDNMMQEFDQQLQYQGFDLQKYFEYLQKDEKEFRDELRPDAYKKLKTRVLISAIADLEKLEADQADLDEELELMSQQYKMEVDKIREMLGTENLSFLNKDIKMRKAVDFMYKNAEIK